MKVPMHQVAGARALARHLKTSTRLGWRSRIDRRWAKGLDGTRSGCPRRDRGRAWSGRELGRGAVARVACAGAQTGNCTESGSITLQGNSRGSQSTDVVPIASTKGTEFASPFSADELAAFDENWATTVDAYPKLGRVNNSFVRRVLTCAVFARNVTDLYADYSKSVNHVDSATGTDTSELFLTLCLNMVYETQRAAGLHSADAASAGCGVALISWPIELKRTGRTYAAVETATGSRACKTPLAVSCRANGLGIQITMRPRARRRKLHQLIGSHVSIGFSNPTSAPVRIKTTFSFSR
jgi:hypothetical protein